MSIWSNSNSQVYESGIYITTDDFRRHKLAYKINCDNEKHVINFYDYWHKPTITVIHNDKKHVHLKKDIFGFQDCKNSVYRFFKNSEYKIAENKHIIIYTVDRTSLPGQGFKKLTDYYYSYSLNSEILPLTAENLKKTYAANKRFCGLLSSTFKNEVPWVYDKTHKIYKVNYLFDLSIANK